MSFALFAVLNSVIDMAVTDRHSIKQIFVQQREK